jgi:DNA invertase Pin-like site-specific DNA recombinase
MDWMYKESSLYLERKFQIYQEFLSLRDYSVETKGQKQRRIESQENEIINAYLSCVNNKEICEKYKISNNTLYRILQRNNIIPFKEKERINK